MKQGRQDGGGRTVGGAVWCWRGSWGCVSRIPGFMGNSGESWGRWVPGLAVTNGGSPPVGAGSSLRADRSPTTINLMSLYLPSWARPEVPGMLSYRRSPLTRAWGAESAYQAHGVRVRRLQLFSAQSQVWVAGAWPPVCRSPSSVFLAVTPSLTARVRKAQWVSHAHACARCLRSTLRRRRTCPTADCTRSISYWWPCGCAGGWFVFACWCGGAPAARPCSEVRRSVPTGCHCRTPAPTA